MAHTQSRTLPQPASSVLLGTWHGAFDALVSAATAAWPDAELTAFDSSPTTQVLLKAAAAAASHAHCQPIEFPQVDCSNNTGLLFKLPPSKSQQVHGLIAAPSFEAARRCVPAFSSSRGDLGELESCSARCWVPPLTPVSGPARKHTSCCGHQAPKWDLQQWPLGPHSECCMQRGSAGPNAGCWAIPATAQAAVARRAGTLTPFSVSTHRTARGRHDAARCTSKGPSCGRDRWWEHRLPEASAHGLGSNPAACASARREKQKAEGSPRAAHKQAGGGRLGTVWGRVGLFLTKGRVAGTCPTHPAHPPCCS